MKVKQVKRAGRKNSMEPSYFGKRQGMENEFDIIYYSDEKAFDKLAEAWRELALRADATICSSPEWVSAWWKHFGANRQRSIFLITLWKNGNLIALAPMYKGYSSAGPIVTERRLQMIGSGGSPSEQLGYLEDYGISDFLDLLVDPDYSEEIAVLLCRLFTSGRLGVDLITFHQAREDSFVMEYLLPEFVKNDSSYTLKDTDTCPYIDLNGQDSLKNFIKQVKSNARRRFRQTLRAIRDDKIYTIEPVETSEEVEQATRTIISLHQKRWNDLGFPGVFYDERFIHFFEQIIHQAHQNGSLWFKQAVDEQGVCASRMLLLYNGRYYDYISGFDDNSPSAKYRPGIGLLLDATEEALTEGVRKIELLRGEEGYKYDFTEKTIQNRKLTIHTEQSRSVLKSLAGRLVYLRALVFMIGSREMRLMRVQRKRVGSLGMVTAYLKFRINSLKMKLGRKN